MCIRTAGTFVRNGDNCPPGHCRGPRPERVAHGVESQATGRVGGAETGRAGRRRGGTRRGGTRREEAARRTCRIGAEGGTRRSRWTQFLMGERGFRARVPGAGCFVCRLGRAHQRESRNSGRGETPPRTTCCCRYFPLRHGAYGQARRARQSHSNGEDPRRDDGECFVDHCCRYAA